MIEAEIEKWMQEKTQALVELKPEAVIIMAKIHGGRFVLIKNGASEMDCAMAAGALQHAAAVEESWHRMILHEAAMKE